MNVSELRKMAQRYWQESYREDMSVLDQARFITGNLKNDLFFHAMLTKHGVEMILKEEVREGCRQWRLVDYKVVDEKKYMMFLLRWS
jgi:HD-like signal output (HDOD) protein